MPRSTTKPGCENSPAEPRLLVYQSIKLKDTRLSAAAAAAAAVVSFEI